MDVAKACDCGEGSDCCPLLHGFIEGVTEEDRWQALGDGQTIEDMIYCKFVLAAEASCPACGEPMAVANEDVNLLARELLAQW